LIGLLNIVVVAGVYKAGFAKSQEAYQDAVVPLFDSLDRIEAMLKDKTYLIGDRLTEADIRLYVTIVSICSAEYLWNGLLIFLYLTDTV
jgi:glutathionyl-hydroquinone reductase